MDQLIHIDRGCGKAELQCNTLLNHKQHGYQQQLKERKHLTVVVSQPQKNHQFSM